MTTATATNTTTEDEGTAALIVELLDPALLLVDLNVRHDARLDPAFIASVKEQGVLVPIVGVRTAEGRVRVRYGHRRTLAAVHAARPSVPVVVIADEATDDDAQVQRIVGQWVENEHRTSLTVAERVGALAQLAAFGVSPAQIAKRTKTGRRDVDAALAVAASDLAKAATVRYDFLDLAQAAVIADFEDDTEAVKMLVAAAKNGQFDHVAQRLRDGRAEAVRRAALEAELTAAGVAVIPAPKHGDIARHLNALDGADGEPLTTDAHRDCPGHAAYVGTVHGWIDTATGEPIADDEDSDDGQDDGDGDRSEGEDEDAAPAQTWGSYLAVRYACTAPTAHGHRDRYGSNRSTAPMRRVAEMDETEREAAREERREVVENNKAWTSAQKVRRAWLRTFSARKTAPKGTAVFVATALATDAEIVAGIGGNALAADLLGLPAGGYGRNTTLQDLIAQASESRAQLIALVQVLAAYEDRTDRNDWRHHRPHTAGYLNWLSANGYALSEVEQRACATTSPIGG
jgi:ParB family chromosome partitioning protein